MMGGRKKDGKGHPPRPTGKRTKSTRKRSLEIGDIGGKSKLTKSKRSSSAKGTPKQQAVRDRDFQRTIDAVSKSLTTSRLTDLQRAAERASGATAFQKLAEKMVSQQGDFQRSIDAVSISLTTSRLADLQQALERASGATAFQKLAEKMVSQQGDFQRSIDAVSNSLTTSRLTDLQQALERASGATAFQKLDEKMASQQGDFQRSFDAVSNSLTTSRLTDLQQALERASGATAFQKLAEKMASHQRAAQLASTSGVFRQFADQITGLQNAFDRMAGLSSMDGMLKSRDGVKPIWENAYLIDSFKSALAIVSTAHSGNIDIELAKQRSLLLDGADIFEKFARQVEDDALNNEQSGADLAKNIQGAVERHKNSFSSSVSSFRNNLDIISFLFVVVYSFHSLYDSYITRNANKDTKSRLGTLENTMNSIMDEIQDLQPPPLDGAYFVVASNLNFRDAPSRGGKILDVLQELQLVTLLEREGDWMYIEFHDYLSGENKKGRIYRKYVRKVITHQ